VEDGIALDIDPQAAAYANTLRAEEFTQDRGTGIRVLQAEDRFAWLCCPRIRQSRLF